MNREFNQYDFAASEPDPHDRIKNEVVHVEASESLSDEASEGEEEERELTEEELLEAEEQAKREERIRKREANIFWQFISGNWLILEGVTGTYRYLMIVAATLFLSVVSIFYSFHLSQRYTRRASEVQLLRERSLEYSRTRFNSTSHTAILKELKRRNIQIYDIQESKTIIEK